MQRETAIHLRIGKSGITEGLIEEIKHQIRRNDPLAIKLLKSFRDAEDRKQAAQSLADATGTHVKSLRGGILLLSRKK